MLAACGGDRRVTDEIDVTAELARFVRDLAARGVGENALGPGDPMPAFMLPNHDGRLVDSSELNPGGPLVLSFYRGEWCRHCRGELEMLAGLAPEVRAKGGETVVLAPQIRGAPALVKRAFGDVFEVLCDLDSGVALTFGLVFRVDEAARAAMLRAGYDMAYANGNDTWFLPIPATYVVDASGTIRAAHVDVDYSQRMSGDAILEALDALPRARSA